MTWTPDSITTMLCLVGLFALGGIKLWSDRTPPKP